MAVNFTPEEGEVQSQESSLVDDQSQSQLELEEIVSISKVEE